MNCAKKSFKFGANSSHPSPNNRKFEFINNFMNAYPHNSDPRFLIAMFKSRDQKS